jgi:hypothetical protein
VAFLEIPPYGPPGDLASWLPGLPTSPIVFGRLVEDRGWFIDPPVVLLLRQGVVAERIFAAGGLRDAKAAPGSPAGTRRYFASCPRSPSRLANFRTTVVGESIFDRKGGSPCPDGVC